MKRTRAEREAGPELIGNVVTRLFAARGWGRRQGQLHLEQAWEEIIGPAAAGHTRVSSLRRGVLEVLVDNAVLLQELAQFHKRRVLEQLRGRLRNTTINDLRFRAGTWEK